MLELEIGGMAFGGKGVGRVGGKVYFAADTIPGDVVKVQVTTAHERYSEAEVIETLKPSALRGPAPCPYATDCGGCQWQGVPYDEQLNWKQSFVSSALKRIAKLTTDTPVHMIPAPELFGYRSRILIRAHLDQHGKLSFGYFRRHSRDLVPITRCLIADPEINAFLDQLAYLDLGELPALTFRLEIHALPMLADGERRGVLVTVYPGDGPKEQIRVVAARINTLANVTWAGTAADLPTAQAHLIDQHLGRAFFTLPSQFQQVNTKLNRVVREVVYQHAAEAQATRILDVCAGSGNLSLALADDIRYVEGIEVSKPAAKVAKQNLVANKVKHAVYLTGDSEAHLRNCSLAGDLFDLVILDPPRQGLREGMIPLKNLRPRTIIYVSCDPTTLARDIGYLCKGDTYELIKVLAFDFFPHTYHVETVAFLRLKQ